MKRVIVTMTLEVCGTDSVMDVWAGVERAMDEDAWCGWRLIEGSTVIAPQPTATEEESDMERDRR